MIEKQLKDKKTLVESQKDEEVALKPVDLDLDTPTN